MSGHPSANELASLFDAVGRAARPFLHALRCPRCAEVARAVFAFHAQEQGLGPMEKGGADYGPAFRKAWSVARAGEKARQEEDEAVPRLLAEILSLAPEERAELLRTVS